MSAGTPAGTTSAVHSAASQPGTPASATVGTSGSASLRFSLMVAKPRSLPSRMCCSVGGMVLTDSSMRPCIRSNIDCALPR